MIKSFAVKCHNCGKEFEVLEEESKFPKKEKYFCSRSCANTRHHSKETKEKIGKGVKQSEKFAESVKKRYGHEMYDKPIINKIKTLERISYCQYCGRECKNLNSLKNHERLCHSNPDRQISYGNHGNMPSHTNKYYTKKLNLRGNIIDKTKYEIDEYAKTQTTCEICGRKLADCVKWESKFAPKHFCIDHDHETLKFRGLLCSVCNRQLGWYEKHKDEIEKYLNKER